MKYLDEGTKAHLFMNEKNKPWSCRKSKANYPPNNQQGLYLNKKRAQVICRMYMYGFTLEQIGKCFSLSRERIRQIINKSLGLHKDTIVEARQIFRKISSQKNHSKKPHRNKKMVGINPALVSYQYWGLGMTIQELAKHYQISFQTMWRFMEENSIPRQAGCRGHR